MVDFLTQHGVVGTRVLEVGGGVGAIQIELLQAGAARTVNLELSPEYEREARELLRDEGFDGRAERRVTDLVEEPDFVPTADVVVMHRVICCYPNMPGLIEAAAEHASRYLVVSFPSDSRPVRAAFWLANQWWRFVSFRTYVYRSGDVLHAAESQGFRSAYRHRGRVWEVAALERAEA
jgi:D-arabinose 1-dehydrogenase-like Zn-dependent alcohol dehydrogenase